MVVLLSVFLFVFTPSVFSAENNNQRPAPLQRRNATFRPSVSPDKTPGAPKLPPTVSPFIKGIGDGGDFFSEGAETESPPIEPVRSVKN